MLHSRKVAIFGSTGSIGCNTLEVIRSLPQFEVHALSGHSNLESLASAAREFSAPVVVATDPDVDTSNFDFGESQILMGPDPLVEVANDPAVDIVVAAIVGCAGLPSTWAAVKAGKTVALANKEALVVAGNLIMPMSRKSGSMIIPVDSEHSAIFQSARGGARREIKRVILTASGGSLRDYTREEMKTVTVEQALDHPTWQMGAKITVDSATLMNKALEVIEARWLFDLRPDQIEVVIHPQSVIHSMVEFVDGSVIAQLSPPDMKLPIQYALTYPDRTDGPAKRLDLTEAMSLDFMPVDRVKFPALDLGFEVAERGGTTGAVLNAANEVAVGAFLNGEIAITDIADHCRQRLNEHKYIADPTLDELMAADQWARQETSKWKLA